MPHVPASDQIVRFAPRASRPRCLYLHPRNFLLALYVLTGVLSCYCQEGSLTSYLLNTTRYSNKFRPVLDDNHTVDVKHSLILHRIVKVVSKAHIASSLSCISYRTFDYSEWPIGGF